MKRLTWPILGLALLTGGAITSPVSAATTPNGHRAWHVSTVQTHVSGHRAITLVRGVAATSAWFNCRLVVQWPHNSTGSHGVIYKSDTTCDSNVPITTTMHGSIFQKPSGFIGPVAASATNTRSDAIPAYNSYTTEHIMYVPKSSVPGLTCRSNYVYQGWTTLAVDAVAFTSGTSPWVSATCT